MEFSKKRNGLKPVPIDVFKIREFILFKKVKRRKMVKNSRDAAIV